VARTDRSGSTRQGSELALERHGSALALVDADRELSYVELARRCDEVTERLGPSRRLVAVGMSNTVSAVVAYLGARRGGHAVVLVKPDRSASCVDRWRPDVELHGAGDDVELVEHGVGTAHELHPDLGLLMSTSGSTGSPKCVRLSGTNLTSNAVAIAEYLGLGPDDRAITSLPLHYCYGLSVLHSHLAVGAGVVMSEQSVVDRCFWSAVSEHAVTSIAAVPHSLDLMDRSGTTSGLRTASLRRLTVAGGRTAPTVVERYAALGERWGWDLVVMYGQTEATARMAYLPPELARRHPGSIGVAIPGGALELVPHDGDDPDVGELEYRGPNVMMGYATTPSDLCRGQEVAALRTGDLARRGEDGLFEIVGRSNRFAKLFGLRIDLDHLEDVLSGHGVSAWCVATDSELALLTTDVRAARVAELVAAETGVPRTAVHVAVAEELPRHPNGKPDRRGVGRTSRSPYGSRSCSAISRRTGTPRRWTTSSASWRPTVAATGALRVGAAWRPTWCCAPARSCWWWARTQECSGCAAVRMCSWRSPGSTSPDSCCGPAPRSCGPRRRGPSPVSLFPPWCGSPASAC
jgi:acyl-CoA synthetase (AMP-forming)/AMP-acid ligase II